MRARLLKGTVSLASIVIGAAAAAVVPAVGTGCQQLDNGAGAGNGTGEGGVAASSVSAGGSSLGGGCGIEATSGVQLCTAVSDCPSVVVDTSAMPSCGFRVRSGVADLICVCGTAVCPVGLYGSCDEASHLLAAQTQAAVCAQVAEGRCAEITAAAPAPTATTPPATPAPTADTTPTTPTAPTSPNPACDRQCLSDCGGGTACASVCNC